MKKLILLTALCAFILSPVAFTGCNQAASARVVEVKTLLSLGTAAKAGLDASVQLLKSNQITVAQFQKIAEFYDTKWQPAFEVAVTAVKSDLLSIASPDLVNLATQFANLVGQLTTHP